MFVTVNVSFNAYACHEVHFVAQFIWSRTYVPKSSRHEVTFHLKKKPSFQNDRYFAFFYNGLFWLAKLTVIHDHKTVILPEWSLTMPKITAVVSQNDR